ncbi:hypothetical protein BH11GEM2_BH11GEM2_29650 [soil metagenome]
MTNLGFAGMANLGFAGMANGGAFARMTNVGLHGKDEQTPECRVLNGHSLRYSRWNTLDVKLGQPISLHQRLPLSLQKVLRPCGC